MHEKTARNPTQKKSNANKKRKILPIYGEEYLIKKHQDKLERLQNGDEDASLKFKKFTGYNIGYFRADDRIRVFVVWTADFFIVIEELLSHKFHQLHFVNNPDILNTYKEDAAKIHAASTINDDDFKPYDPRNLPISKESKIISVKKISVYNNQHVILTHAQSKLFDIQTPAKLCGGPGTGKSLMGLELLAEQAIRAHAKNRLSLLYVTKSEYLAKDMETKFKANVYYSKINHLIRHGYLQVHFKTAQELFAAKGQPVEEKSPPTEALDQKPTKAKPEAKASSPEQAFESWLTSYRKRQADRMKAFNRTGNAAFKPSSEFLTLTPKIVHEAFRDIAGKCKSLQQYYDLGVKCSLISNEETKKDIFLAFLEYSKNIDRSMLVTPSSQNPVYDFLVCDEAQDFHAAELEEMLGKVSYYNAWFLDSEMQRITDSRSNKANFTSLLPSYSKLTEVHLTVPFRNPELVGQMINHNLELKHTLMKFFMLKDTSHSLQVAHNTKPGRIFWREPSQLEKALPRNHSRMVITLEKYKADARILFNTYSVFTIEEIKGLECEYLVLFNFFNEETFEKISRLLQDQGLSKHLAEKETIQLISEICIAINRLNAAVSRTLFSLLMVQVPQRELNTLIATIQKDLPPEAMDLRIKYNDTDGIESKDEDFLQTAKSLFMHDCKQQAEDILKHQVKSCDNKPEEIDRLIALWTQEKNPPSPEEKAKPPAQTPQTTPPKSQTTTKVAPHIKEEKEKPAKKKKVVMTTGASQMLDAETYTATFNACLGNYNAKKEKALRKLFTTEQITHLTLDDKGDNEYLLCWQNILKNEEQTRTLMQFFTNNLSCLPAFAWYLKDLVSNPDGKVGRREHIMAIFSAMVQTIGGGYIFSVLTEQTEFVEKISVTFFYHIKFAFSRNKKETMATYLASKKALQPLLLNILKHNDNLVDFFIDCYCQDKSNPNQCDPTQIGTIFASLLVNPHTHSFMAEKIFTPSFVKPFFESNLLDEMSIEPHGTIYTILKSETLTKKLKEIAPDLVKQAQDLVKQAQEKRKLPVCDSTLQGAIVESKDGHGSMRSAVVQQNTEVPMRESKEIAKPDITSFISLFPPATTPEKSISLSPEKIAGIWIGTIKAIHEDTKQDSWEKKYIKGLREGAFAVGRMFPFLFDPYKPENKVKSAKVRFNILFSEQNLRNLKIFIKENPNSEEAQVIRDLFLKPCARIVIFYNLAQTLVGHELLAAILDMRDPPCITKDMLFIVMLKTQSAFHYLLEHKAIALVKKIFMQNKELDEELKPPYLYDDKFDRGVKSQVECNRMVMRSLYTPILCLLSQVPELFLFFIKRNDRLLRNIPLTALQRSFLVAGEKHFKVGTWVLPHLIKSEEVCNILWQILLAHCPLLRDPPLSWQGSKQQRLFSSLYDDLCTVADEDDEDETDNNGKPLISYLEQHEKGRELITILKKAYEYTNAPAALMRKSPSLQNTEQKNTRQKALQNRSAALQAPDFFTEQERKRTTHKPPQNKSAEEMEEPQKKTTCVLDTI